MVTNCPRFINQQDIRVSPYRKYQTIVWTVDVDSDLAVKKVFETVLSRCQMLPHPVAPVVIYWAILGDYGKDSIDGGI